MNYAEGGYRFIPGVFQYSAGVAALPGFCLERITFKRPVPLSDGFRLAATLITAAGRPLISLCACELRSPAPFTDDGFKMFNKAYVGELLRWGVISGSTNPVARSNVCPEMSPPSVPCLHAFSFTVKGGPSSFVVSGSGEVPEGKSNYRDHIVCLGDHSAQGLRQKARFVMREMELRLGALGFGWHDATATQVYTIRDFHSFAADEMVSSGAASMGLTWQFCRPPIIGLEFEMDCRGIQFERVIHV
ncbi:MAG: hypothetical protein L0210_07005 [Rhodospirillales bacterium]|nr:hypothetical protein [Rhodospirillales bacterium]